MESKVTILEQPQPPMATNDQPDIFQWAIMNGASPEQLMQLMDVQERNQQRKAKMAFDEAMSAAMAEIQPVLKTQKVDFSNKSGGRTNYSYESYGDVDAAVRPICAKYGLSYRFASTDIDGARTKTTIIISHKEGHREENSLTAPNDVSGNKNAIQAIGSVQTYLMRMLLKAAFGVAVANDDDAQSASNQEAAEKISDAQVKRILDLIRQGKVDIAKFCNVQKIEAVPDILAKNFGAIERQLLTKIENMAKGAA